MIEPEKANGTNHAALGFLLLGLAAAGRALLGVPGQSSMAEVTLSMLGVIGLLLLADRHSLPALPSALGQVVLELILCGSQTEGAWRRLRVVLRAADLWLVLVTVVLALGLAASFDPGAAFAKSSRAMGVSAAAVLAVQTVLLWLSARNPADAALATASAAVFVAFSVLLLWFTALMLRLYGRLRTPLPPRRGWRHRG